jgi:Rap1a immunity proteins
MLAVAPTHFVSGAILKESCERKADSCYSFILGVVDAVSTIAPNVVCLRPHVNPDELRSIVLAELDSDPSSAGFGAAQYVLIALREAFPCVPI